MLMKKGFLCSKRGTPVVAMTSPWVGMILPVRVDLLFRVGMIYVLRNELLILGSFCCFVDMPNFSKNKKAKASSAMAKGSR